MKTINNQHSYYNLSENVSDFLFEYLNENTFLDNEEVNNTNFQTENPKITFFEQRIAALEGGVSALAVKSFNKAKYSVIKGLLKSGDNIVTFNSASLYQKDKEKLSRSGIEVRFSHDGNLKTFEGLIDKKTKLIYLETISSELLSIPDFQKIKYIARAWNIPVLVDNTAGAAGYISRPLTHGANILIEKTSQWLPSHKGLIGAVIVDGGNYDWFNGKFPHINNKVNFLSIKPNINRADKKDIAFSLINYFKKEGNINLSSHPIPEDPFSLIYDFDHLNTIAQRQSDNARKLVAFLRVKEEIKSVNYTGMPENPSYFKASIYFRNGYGPYLSFNFTDESLFEQFRHFANSEENILKDYISLENNTVYFTAPTFDFIEIAETLDNFFYSSRSINEFKNRFASLNSLESII